MWNDEGLTLDAQIALAGFLQEYSWDYWFTATSKDKDRIKHPTVAIKRALGAVSGFDRSFVGAEPHRLGGWHTHGLISSSVDPGEKEGIRVLLERRLSRYGYCQVSPVRNARAVASYVSKYITKDLAEWCLTGRISWAQDKLT